MRYTCISINQLPSSIAYFRLPGDIVSCVSGIHLNGELHLDVRESGTYTIIESQMGLITGNFTKIVPGGTIIKIGTHNVTVTITAPEILWNFSTTIAVIVGSFVTLLLFCFFFYKYLRSPTYNTGQPLLPVHTGDVKQVKPILEPNRYVISTNPLMNL